MDEPCCNRVLFRHWNRESVCSLSLRLDEKSERSTPYYDSCQLSGRQLVLEKAAQLVFADNCVLCEKVGNYRYLYVDNHRVEKLGNLVVLYCFSWQP